MIRRFSASFAAVALTALVITGCASGTGSTPTSTPEPSGTAEPSPTPGTIDDLAAAWLDEGREIAVITWGSSGCVPQFTDVGASGQEITVTLENPDPQAACTADYAPRASLVPVPDGVDLAKDVTVTVTLDDATGSTQLKGDDHLTGGDETDYKPTAGWFNSHELVLLTWGSSTCPPVVESTEINADDEGATITFQDATGACTRDMAPRLTILGFAGEHDHGYSQNHDFTLTLVGDGLDGTITVH